jgi:hypothetical protein
VTAEEATAHNNGFIIGLSLGLTIITQGGGGSSNLVIAVEDWLICGSSELLDEGGRV